MGDFAFKDLTRDDGLYPHHRAATCWGCGGLFVPESRCYADQGHIWHSRCWPTIDRSLRKKDEA